MRLECQILLKSPPINLLAGSAPGVSQRKITLGGRDGEKLKNNWSNRTVTWLGNGHLGWQQKGRHAGKQTRNLVGIRAKIQGNM